MYLVWKYEYENIIFFHLVWKILKADTKRRHSVSTGHITKLKHYTAAASKIALNGMAAAAWLTSVKMTAK